MVKKENLKTFFLFIFVFMVMKWQWISGSGLKLLAVVSMVLDHLAAFIWQGDPFWMTRLFKVGTHLITPYYIARYFGRLAFPLFAFLIVEGFIHTHSRRGYGRNLFIFALISEIPWNLVHNGTILYWGQNVFFTLFFGFLALCAIEYLKDEKIKMGVSLIGLLVFSYFFRADYNFVGVSFIIMLYLLRENVFFQAVVGSAMLPTRWIAGLAFIPISMYNGKRGFIRGTVAKYCFYAFYPVHLLVIYLLTVL